MVNGYLMNLTDKSGSWKNSFLEALNHIYKEAPWHCKYPVIKPDYPRFARNSKKADIFTADELDRFFDGTNWVDDGRPLRQEYLESVFHRVLAKAGICCLRKRKI